jgi:sec-independent protein translocase protein TatA
VIGDILQPTHLLFVLVIALLVLGPKRLPEVGRALGNGLRDFKSAINGDEDHHQELTDAPGFENYRADALADEVQDPSMVAAQPASSVSEPSAVTSPDEPAPPASPEHARDATAHPSNSVASEPTERLG